LGVKLADLVPGHSRPPDSVPRNIRVHRVAKHPAVDLQVGTVLSLFAPEGALAERAILRLEILVPDLAGLHDVRVAVENGKRIPAHGRFLKTAQRGFRLQ